MLQDLKRHLINIPGWRTPRKIVVFESDDWGMIRMASRDSFARLLKKGYPVDRCHYNSNDALESNEDLELLAEVLMSVKDKNGCPAKFTMNNIVANPDFQKIREAGYQQYFYEPFTKTLEGYPNCNKVLALYREGIREEVFQMQFHGREHVHINNWLKKLQRGEKLFVDAFEENMFTQYYGAPSSCRKECLDAMATYCEEDFKVVGNSIQEGLRLFQDIWGYASESIIAPCYTWHTDLEKKMNEQGIRIIQGGRAQKQPNLLEKPYTIKRKYVGQSNALNQRYLVRNVNFEPAEHPDMDSVDAALKEIDIAFKWNKPAVISTHRVNYIGSINAKNRTANLVALGALLKRTVKKWSNVEFMSTDQLGRIIF